MVLVHGGDLAVQSLEHGGAVVVQTEYIHRCPAAFVLEHDCIEGSNRRCVPHVGAGKVDHHPRWVLGVLELRDEVIAGGEEQFPMHFVGNLTAIWGHGARHSYQVRNTSREQDCGG